jgi:choline dehydrogenase
MRVRGVKNLRIVDASIFPDQISGNTNATVVAMADKISSTILSANLNQTSLNQTKIQDA